MADGNESKAHIAKDSAGTGDASEERTFIRTLSLGGFLGGGCPCAVDVKDDKIVRVRPIHFDMQGINTWSFERNGKTLEPIPKSLPSPFMLAYKKRAYSPNRIKYPLKRVDWDPNGARNPQNRGKSKYRRISWDEAAELVASELKRVCATYGPAGVLVQADGHGECKSVHAAHGCPTLVVEKLAGDKTFTQQVRNPDSWEGWYWGAMHMWGTGFCGTMHPTTNTIQDITENSDMVLCWGMDPETTPWGTLEQFASRLCYYWTEVGLKQIYICPDLNYGAAIHADKWIPVLPNTDAALQLAIAHVWIVEGTYDKEYVATHVVGFDKFADYVLGKEDGVPKTPEWASPKCGVPEWTIKALAREFASKTTSVAHYFGGGMIRGPYSHEPARLEVCLLGMQGLGKPGVHQGIVPFGGMPRSITDELAKFQSAFHKEVDEDKGKAAAEYYGSWKAEDPIARRHTTMTSLIAKQMIPKTLIQDAIEKPPVTVWGSGAINAPVEDQFVKYTYPIAQAEGGSEIHMMWMDNPCRTTCWNDGNATIAAMRNPKIECVVAQHPWLENDCLLADIILPSNTTFEVDDIVPNVRQGLQLASVSLQKKAIEPVGESKSDYEVVLEIARLLGLYEKVTNGLSINDEIRDMFERMGFSKLITWEDLNDKQYVVVPTAKDWRTEPAGLFHFYQDPEAHPLPTPTGKLEFYSERLAQHFPDDMERQALPKWIEKGISHDERISGERAEQYPFLVMSNHGRWRMHSQCDDIPWTREAPTCKVQGEDGYLYEPLWINTHDAAERGIESGDIVKVFNERGIVLGGAYVTERLMPGVLYMDHGARTDTIAAAPNEYVDRGGAINLISPRATTSKNCAGQATSGFLADVAKVQSNEMQAWKEKYPEAFAREYDPARGLGFDAWVEGGAE